MIISIGSAIALVCLTIAVDNLLVTTSCRRIAEYCTYTSIWCTCRIHPSTLHISITLINDTCRVERASYTEVIDTTAEVVEQRVVETADGVAIAMENTLEALFVGAYRGPRMVDSDCLRCRRVGLMCRIGFNRWTMVNICAHEEFQVFTTLHLLI